MTRLEQMFAELSGARQEVLPSKYWVQLNKQNLQQLETEGYDNFKRTLALNYFTFLVHHKSDQVRFLTRNLEFRSILGNAIQSLLIGKHSGLRWKKSLWYSFHTLMLWEYVSKLDHDRILNLLSEPEEGNPFKVVRHGKLISQDLANSVLEFMSITGSLNDKRDVRTIMELGAGYGRTAFVFLSRMPSIRYVIVDIPPALYVAETYLSHVFPAKKVFRFRPFKTFAEVQKEFEDSDIAFFLPSQLDLLPDKVVDLFLNISSLHEMRMDQIRYYFDVIDRLVRSFFYFKQWKISKIPYENIIVTEKDYPVKAHWNQIFWRECKVQTEFFEAMFQLSKKQSA